MKYFCITILTGLISMSSVSAAETTAKTTAETAVETGKHLFIFSGQSNMRRLKPVDITPAVEANFDKDSVIVVKHDQSSTPIRKWDKGWMYPSTERSGNRGGKVASGNGGVYSKLMVMVKEAIKGKKINTVTFFWMQGEADSGGDYGLVYEASLRRLIKQVEDDLGRTDVNYIIGRLSDFPSKNEGWSIIRKAQVTVADSSSRGAWIDTDDLNGTGNALHYTKDGYKKFGKRLVEKARELIDKHKNKKKEIDKDKK